MKRIFLSSSIALVLLAVSIGYSAIAGAQTLESPAPESEPQAASGETPEAAEEGGEQWKSPDRAFGLSALSTLVPFGVGGILAGVGIGVMFTHTPGSMPWTFPLSIVGCSIAGASWIFGPTAGHLYARNYKRGLVMLSTRILLTGVGFAFYGIWSQGEDVMIGAPILAAFGLAAIAVGIVDLATIKKATRKANEKRNKRVSMALAPMVTSTPEGRSRYGLALAGRF